MKKDFSLLGSISKHAISEDGEWVNIEGYASISTEDRIGDEIQSSAWSDSVLKSYMQNPIVLHEHDFSKAVGTVKSIHSDEKGLYVNASVLTSTEAGKLIKSGILKGFSVQYLPISGVKKSTKGVSISELELLEVSVTSVPMHRETVFSIKKHFNSDEEYDSYINQLTNTNMEQSTFQEKFESFCKSLGFSKGEPVKVSDHEEVKSIMKSYDETLAAKNTKVTELETSLKSVQSELEEIQTEKTALETTNEELVAKNAELSTKLAKASGTPTEVVKKDDLVNPDPAEPAKKNAWDLAAERVSKNFK